MTSPSTLKRAATIDELRKTCKPMPLEGEALKEFYVETDSARNLHHHTRQRLASALETEPARVLFCGHPGCGKSTELNKFLSEQGDKWLPVKFSLFEEMTPVHALAEDLVLVITAKIVEAAKAENIRVDEAKLQSVYDYFAAVTKETGTSKDASSLTAAGASTDSSLLGKLTGLMAQFKAEIRLESHSDTTVVHTLRQRPSNLRDQANRVIESIQVGLKERGKRLLVVVEDIDKLDLKRARDMFVNHHPLLTGLSTDIIYTIPIFLFHSTDAQNFQHNFDAVIPLPMITVFDPDTGRAAGHEIVKTIIRERVEDALIAPNALDLLIEKTGGVLRHVFEVLNTVSTMTNVEPPVSVEAVRYGLDQLRKSCAQMVALPIDPIPTVTSVNELYDRLTFFAKRQMKGEKSALESDPVNQLLLKTCALIEYNGEGWVGVHPLIVEHLQRLGRLPQ